MFFDTLPTHDKLNLICFPYAGGNSHFYTRWENRLGREIAIHPLHLPGRGNRFKTTPLRDMDNLVDSIINDMSVFENMRVAFVGTSMGGWIAYHLAQKLSGINPGLMPECLVICSTAAPEYRTGLPDLDGVDTATALARMQAFNPACIETLQHPELALLFLPILQADFQLCRGWKFEQNPRLHCPILAFHADRDELVADNMMSRWSELTDKAFTLSHVKGGHFFTEAPSADFFHRLKTQLDSISAAHLPE